MAAKKSASLGTTKKTTPKTAQPRAKATATPVATKPRVKASANAPKPARATKASTQPAPPAQPARPVTPSRTKGASSDAPHLAALLELRQLGLSYPETHMKSPWPDHMDLAVRNKTFAYLSTEGEPLSISCKLPESCQTALSLPFASPTAYGLGKSGWVTATFTESDTPPVEFLKTWLEESYRAVAPKTLSKQLPRQ